MNPTNPTPAGTPGTNAGVSEVTDAELMAVLNERDRLRTELAEQKRLNLQLAERLRACSECLGRVAEKGGTVVLTREGMG